MTRLPEPKVLQKNATHWLFKLKNLSNSSPTTKEEKKQLTLAQNKYRHQEIKAALVKMFHGKCAYCESKITLVTYGAIEHFFPKSLFIDLTFAWSNLLLACDVCNDRGHKGTSFPLDNQGNPLLLNPTDPSIDPNMHLEFVWDAVAGLASVYGRDERGKTVERIFDLNGNRGRKELIAHRSQYVKRLFALLRLARSGDPEAIALLQESCDPSAEYCAFARVHIEPHLRVD